MRAESGSTQRERSPRSRAVTFAVAALTAGAVVLQSAGVATASDVRVEAPANVLANMEEALIEVGATPTTVTAEDGSGVDVQLPGAASQAAVATTPAGVLTMEVPAQGRDLAQGDDSITLLDGSATDTAVAVQRTESGLRALVHIDSIEAPERFQFPIGGDVAEIKLTADGGAAALDAEGHVVATAPAPWAIDANGVSVPTRFEVDGTTLIQTVDHRGGDYAYGIVADPSWYFWAKCGAALTLFIAQNLTPAKLARAGTILKSTYTLVRYLGQFPSVSQASRALAAWLGSASGVNDLVFRCWPD